MFNVFRLKTAAQYKDFVDQSEQEFIADVEAAKKARCHTYVISNENLHSRIETETMAARIRNFLADHFSQIELVVFLRPQVDLMVSRVSLNARAGILAPKIREISPAKPYYDYLSMMERWKKIPGEQIVVPFKRYKDVIGKFCDLLGVDRTEFSDPVRVNEKIDFRAAMLSYNLGLNRFRDAEENFNRNYFVDDLPFNDPVTIGRDEAQALHSRFKDDNAALVAKFSDLMTEEDLTPDFEAYPEDGNLDRVFTQSDMAPVMQYIVRRFNAELWLERARTKAEAYMRFDAEFDRAAAADSRAQAMEFLRRAKAADIAEMEDSISKVEKTIEIR